jgi:hypothetical protein
VTVGACIARYGGLKQDFCMISKNDIKRFFGGIFGLINSVRVPIGSEKALKNKCLSS